MQSIDARLWARLPTVSVEIVSSRGTALGHRYSQTATRATGPNATVRAAGSALLAAPAVAVGPWSMRCGR